MVYLMAVSTRLWLTRTNAHIISVMASTVASRAVNPGGGRGGGGGGGGEVNRVAQCYGYVPYSPPSQPQGEAGRARSEDTLWQALWGAKEHNVTPGHPRLPATPPPRKQNTCSNMLQLMRPSIGPNVSCALGDCFTCRPKGHSQPRELWFSIYTCI